MRIAGLGYEAEYITLDDRGVVHAAVTHVDPLVRAGAPVWLPYIAPSPLCGLGRAACRKVVTRTSGPLCRSCAETLRDLDEWVRQAEARLAGMEDPVSVTNASPPPRNRVHSFPF